MKLSMAVSRRRSTNLQLEGDDLTRATLKSHLCSKPVFITG